MQKKRLIIASRQSPLARYQANVVMSELQALYPDMLFEWQGIITEGDKNLTEPLSEIGGKALFLKEIQMALLAGEVDIAVHSLKDVPPDNPPDLHLSAFLKREDPRDVLITKRKVDFNALPDSANIGTGSLRRQTQLHHLRPDLNFIPIRGNIETRLNKVWNGELDAIVLAAAALKRLSLTEHISFYLPPEICLPAIGQGVIACESRKHDHEISQLLHPLNDTETALCVTAERALQATLGGNCKTPIGGYACIQAQQLWLRGFLASPDGQFFSKKDISQSVLSYEQALQCGKALGNQLKQ